MDAPDLISDKIHSESVSSQRSDSFNIKVAAAALLSPEQRKDAVFEASRAGELRWLEMKVEVY